MSGLLTLDQIVELYGRKTFPIAESQIQNLLQDADENNQSLGHLLRASNDYAAGRPVDALHYLLRLRHETRSMLLPIIAIIIWLRRMLDDTQNAAYDVVSFAEDASAQGLHDLALEACSGAVFLDQTAQFEITKNPAQIVRITELYERAACSMCVEQEDSACAYSSDGRLKVALVVGNLVDHVVAYSRRALNFARYLDESKYDVRVYSTENLTAREQPLFPFGIENGPSSETATASCSTLAELGVPVYFGPRNLPARTAAKECIRQMVEDRIDIAIFQTGIASPIDWLVARLAPIPVKAGIHIGSSPFNTGFDAYFFDNPKNIEREGEFWTDEMGSRVVLNSGVDIERLQNRGVLARSELGIPDGVPLMGTVSNHLGERMSSDYVNVIIRALLRHPEAYYLGIGIPPGSEIIDQFKRAGVAERTRFPGPASMTSVVLKMMDIYACEFPVGGSESVKEAIACGIPVLAMRAGEGHAECAAANIVGKALAVPDYDVAAYRTKLFHWLENPEERQAVGQLLAQRAKDNYSFQSYASAMMEYLCNLLKTTRQKR